MFGIHPRLGAAVALVTVLNRPVTAQDATAGTVDVIDIWNRIRDKPPAETTIKPDERMKAVSPVIGAKPSAGVMFGVAGNVAFFAGDPQTTHISSAVVSGTFSTKKQTALSARFTLLARNDAWRLEGDNRAQWTSQDTYGLGTSADAGAAVNAKYDFFRVHETIYRRTRSNVFIGLGLHFDTHQDVRPGTDVSTDSWDVTEYLQYSRTNNFPLEHQTSAGFSANLLRDTRDSIIDPRRGWYANTSYRGLINGFLGGSSGWQLVHVDTRAYAPLAADNRQRLAFWTFGDFVFGGHAPYFDLPATGMDMYGRSGRGYGEGRFRGERLVYGEIEYRASLTSNNLIGMVAFVNATTVTNLQKDEHLFDSAAPGAGAGLRVLVNKRSRTNLCFDVGFGKESSRGVYLAVQEAF